MSQLYTVGSPIRPGHGIYIRRPADDQLVSLCAAGHSILLLGPPQTGKTSMLLQALPRLRHAGVRVALLDLAPLRFKQLVEDWWSELLQGIATQLELAVDLRRWWADAEAPPAQLLQRFVQDVVLPGVAGPVAIVLDGIEHTLGLPYAADLYVVFETLLKQRQAATSGRVSLVLGGMGLPLPSGADVLMPLFALTRQIELGDFSLHEAAPLAAGLGLPDEPALEQLRQVLTWSWGQPYLTQRICAALAARQRDGLAQLASPDELKALVERLFTGQAAERDRHREALRETFSRPGQLVAGALKLYRRIVRGKRVAHDPAAPAQTYLRRAGLARRQNDQLIVRNPIYRALFDDHWRRLRLARARPRRRAAWILPLLLCLLLLGNGLLVALSLRSRGAAGAAPQVVDSPALPTAQARIAQLRSAQSFAMHSAQVSEPELGLLLAIEAARLDDSPASAQALRAALERAHARTMLIGHAGQISSGRWSPDGSRILTTSWDKTARIWDGTSGEELTVLSGHQREIHHGRWSPGGQRVATADYAGGVRIWEAASGKQLHLLDGHEDDILDMSWSPSGTALLTVSADGTARIWDPEEGERIALIGDATLSVWGARWSPDSRRVLTSSDDKTARVWDAATGEQLFALTRHGDAVYPALWSPDGKRIFTLDRAGEAWLWDAADGKVLQHISGSGLWAEDARWSRDGQWVMLLRGGDKLELLDASTGEWQRSLEGQAGTLHGQEWSPDGSWYATASSDGHVRVWSTHDGKLLAALRGPMGSAWSLDWHPAGDRLLITGNNTTAYVWDRRIGAERSTLFGHVREIWAAQWSADGRRILTTGRDSSLRVWDALEGKQLQLLRGHTGTTWDAAWSPDEQLILSGAGDGTARIWDAASGAERFVLRGHDSTIWDVAWSPDGTRALTAGGDGTARIWDSATGDQLQLLEQGETVSEANWSPDGSHVLTAGSDGTARIWDAATGEQVQLLEGHEGYVYHGLWSPDGRRILTAGEDDTARIWDAADGKELRVLENDSEIDTAIWSPDGRQIATAGYYQAVSVWSAASGEELYQLSGHQNSVDQLWWSPQGRYLVSTSYDSTARIWDTESRKLLLTLSSQTPVRVAQLNPAGTQAMLADDDGVLRIFDLKLSDLIETASRRSTRHLGPEERKAYDAEP